MWDYRSNIYIRPKLNIKPPGHQAKLKKEKTWGGLPWWWVPNAGFPGLIPGQGTRSHMPQLKDPAYYN